MLRLVKNGIHSSLTLFESNLITSRSISYPEDYMTKEPSEQRKYADEMGEEEILNSTLSQIRRATEEKLGRSVEIHAIGYPEHFKNVPCETKFLNTAIKSGSVPEIKDMM